MQENKKQSSSSSHSQTSSQHDHQHQFNILQLQSSQSQPQQQLTQQYLITQKQQPVIRTCKNVESGSQEISVRGMLGVGGDGEGVEEASDGQLHGQKMKVQILVQGVDDELGQMSCGQILVQCNSSNQYTTVVQEKPINKSQECRQAQLQAKYKSTTTQINANTQQNTEQPQLMSQLILQQSPHKQIIIQPPHNSTQTTHNQTSTNLKQTQHKQPAKQHKPNNQQQYNQQTYKNEDKSTCTASMITKIVVTMIIVLVIAMAIMYARKEILPTSAIQYGSHSIGIMHVFGILVFGCGLAGLCYIEAKMKSKNTLKIGNDTTTKFNADD